MPMSSVLPLACWQLESLPAMVQGVYSDDPQVQLEATTQFRKLLSIGEFRTGVMCYIESLLGIGTRSL